MIVKEREKTSLRDAVIGDAMPLRPNETTESFLARADGALYAAKAQGRNRIARA